MIAAIGEITARDKDLFLKMWKTMVDPATRLLQDHRHINFEIAMVTRGHGTYHTVSGVLPIEAGDVFVFPSNEPHWILKIMDEGLEIINLHFNLQFFRTACTISERYPNLFFAHSGSFPSRIPAENAGGLRSLLQRVEQELTRQGAEYESYVYSLLNLLFAELVRTHNFYLPEDGTHTLIEKIGDSLRYIDSHFAEDITLAQIAAQSGMSPNYFSKLFKDCFHIRLWDYVISKRVDKAKQFLRSDGGCTVLDIALSCGFNNTANFNRAFLRFTGVTPSEYRRGQEILH